MAFESGLILEYLRFLHLNNFQYREAAGTRKRQSEDFKNNQPILYCLTNINWHRHPAWKQMTKVGAGSL